MEDISRSMKTVFPVTLIMKTLNGYLITKEPHSYLRNTFCMQFGSASHTKPEHVNLE